MPTLGTRMRTAINAFRFIGGHSAFMGAFSFYPTIADDPYRMTLEQLPFSSAVMTCVQWIMRTMPQAPPIVRTFNASGDFEILYNHPLVQLLQHPNAFQPADLILQGAVTSYCLYGNAYFIKLRNALGEVAELWYEPNYTIRPHFPADGSSFIDYYELSRNGRFMYQLEPRDVIHFRHGIDDDNIRMGFSPLRSVLREIFTDEEASMYTAALLHNTGVPSVVISPVAADARVSDEQAENIKQTYQERFTGTSRGTALVMKGPTKIDVLTFDPTQMNLRALRQIAEERVSGLLGIPAIVSGLGTGLDHATYSNYASALKDAWQNCIIPIQKAFADAFTKQLLTDYTSDPNTAVSFDYRPVAALQEDVNAMYVRLTSGFTSGWLMRSDARRQANLSVDPERDDVYVFDVQQQFNALQSSTRERAPAGDQLPAEQPLRAVASVVKPKELAMGTWQYWNPGKIKAHTLSLGALDTKSLSDSLAEIFASVSASFAASLVVAYSDLAEHAANDERERDVIVRAIAAVAAVRHAFASAFSDAYAELRRRVLAQIAQTLALPVAQTMRPDLLRAIDALEHDQLEALLDAITADTADALSVTRDARVADIRDAVAGAYRFPALAESHGVTAAIAYRAMLVAKTESAIARNQIAVAGYQSSGVVASLAVSDGPDCGWTSHDDPVKADGMIVGFEEARAFPIAHPSCVRTLTPVLASDVAKE